MRFWSPKSCALRLPPPSPLAVSSAAVLDLSVVELDHCLSMDIAISLGKNAAQVAADFAPVPWMGPAVGALVGIMQLCQNVVSNRLAALQLRDRCHYLLLSLHASAQGSSPETMGDALNNVIGVLRNVEQSMNAWANQGRLRSFVAQKVIAEDIQRCHLMISDCCSSFQFTSHMEIHKWQDGFEQNNKRDHDEIMLYLGDIRNAQIITNEALASNNELFRKLLAMMQQGLEDFHVGDRRHIGLQNNLYRLQQQSQGELLPDYNLHRGEVVRIGSNAVGGNAAMDIWEGLYLGREKVAIKVIRGVDVTPNTMRRFLREVKIWRDVWEVDRGEHVLPFLGVCKTDGKYPYVVSPWMHNGDAITYVKKYPDVDRRTLIRGIAEGIHLLHTFNPPIVHGDIKGCNVIIDDYGKPLLADFGLSQIMQEVTGIPFTQSRGISDSYRWFAPELVSEPGILSFQSDVFSFAMTVLELMTSDHPFAHVRRTPEVLIKLNKGERPLKPKSSVVVQRGLDDTLWALLEQCWLSDPDARPTIQQILEVLP